MENMSTGLTGLKITNFNIYGPRQDLKLRRRIKSERIDDETHVDYDSVTMRNKSERIDDETSHNRCK